MKLDEFHYHEMVDRCSLMMEIIAEQLLEHPAVQKEKKIREKVNKAFELLSDAYQISANIRLDKYPLKKVIKSN